MGYGFFVEENGSFGALRLLRTTEETEGFPHFVVILRVGQSPESKNPYPYKKACCLRSTLLICN